MPNKGIITHKDIAEPNLTKPVIDDFIAFLAVLNNTETQIKDIAKALKITFRGADFGSTDGLTRFTQGTRVAAEAMSAFDKIKKELRATTDKLNAELTLEAQLLAESRLELERIKKETKDWAKMNSESTGAYDKASMKLNQLRKAWKDLAIVNKENTEEAKALKKELDALDATLKKVDADAGQHQRNVGNYASGYDGLRNSINQLTREAPAFANSLNTGFMAISNNLPILVDEINRLREANKQLDAQGEKSEPIWKALGKSLFSWQTLISLGVTLLTVYGGKLIDMALGVDKVKKSLDAAAKAQKSLNEEVEHGLSATDKRYKESIKQLDLNRKLELERLKEQYDAIEEENLTLKDREEYNQKVYEIEVKYNNKSIEQIQTYLAQKEQYKKKLDDQQAFINKIDVKDDEELKARKDVLQAELNMKYEAYSDSYRDLLAEEEVYDVKTQEAALKRSMANREAARKEGKEAEKDAKEAEKLLIEALELQHKMNVLQIESVRDANERKKLLMEEEAAFEMQMNEFRIKDAQQREEANLAIASKFEREMKDILNAEEKARKDSLDKQFEDLVNQQQAINDSIIEADQYKRKKQLEQEKADEKARKEALKAQQKFAKDSLSLLEQNAKQENQIQLSKTDTEINNSRRRADMLKELAIKGNKDAADSIALEERRQAELEAKKFKQQKTQKRQELFFAGLKAYTANLESNPTIALQKTLKDLTALSAGLRALPAFEKGTQDTGNNGTGVDGKGGFHAILHPNERVLTKDQNRKIGDLSNDELANLALYYQRGIMPEIIMSNHVDDRLLSETKSMKEEIQTLTKVIENKPVPSFRYDEVNKMMVDIIETKHNRKSIKRGIKK